MCFAGVLHGAFFLTRIGGGWIGAACRFASLRGLAFGGTVALPIFRASGIKPQTRSGPCYWTTFCTKEAPLVPPGLTRRGADKEQHRRDRF